MPHLGPLSWFFAGVCVLFLLILIINIFEFKKPVVFVKPFFKKKMKPLSLKWC